LIVKGLPQGVNAAGFCLRPTGWVHLIPMQPDRFDLEAAQGGNHLKAATIVGILLIVVGLIGFIAGGFSFTHRKRDVDMGPVHVSHNQTKTVPISPILSTVALIGGIGLVVVGARS
jgi:hypothetical protein